MNYILLLILIPTISLAEIVTDCGEYSVRGIVRAKIDGLKLIINEKTQSEYTISMSPSEQGQIGNLIDRDVTVELLLDKKIIGQSFATSKILSSKSRIPNPLNPNDTGFSLLKKIPCISE